MLWTLCALIQGLIPCAACARNSNFALPGQTAALVRESMASSSDFTVAGKSSTSQPFDLIDNRIIINVSLNGKGPFRFIFDSAGVAVVSPELARYIGWKLIRPSTGGGGVGENTLDRGATAI